MSAGGQLRELVRIEERECVTDPFGGLDCTWHNRATVPARMVAMKGREEIVSARLTGIQPWIITVRNNGPAASATTDWRLVDDRRGTLFNIRSVVRSERGEWADFLCEVGS